MKQSFFSFIKDGVLSLFRLYKNHIKGRSLALFGKNVPMTAILIVALIGVYALVFGGSDKSVKQEQQKSTITERQLSNTYDKDGIKVYDLKRCEQGICGLLENTTKNNISRVVISVNFTDKSGNVLAEGGVDAENVEPMTRSHITVPTDADFDKFILTDVTVAQ